MKFKCLAFDHDDTVVNSTATIHHPCFVEYLKIKRPGLTCTLEDYFIKNFSPGFLEMCRDEYSFSEEDFADETEFWRSYVENHVPTAYAGLKEIMERHRSDGGIIAVVSHSFSHNIYRDYEANGLPKPDAVFGWDQPPELRKPSPYPIKTIMEEFGISPNDILMIDDLKPGYDMAQRAGIAFAAAGWAYQVPYIEEFMRKNCDNYFKTVEELNEFLK